MKIRAVKTFPVMAWRPHLFVIVETDQDLCGIGESGLTWQEATVEQCVQRLSQLLIGEDPLRTEHLWQLMFRASFFPADRVNCAAISALDLALWDLKGKALGQPVYNLLGGLLRDRVACYPHNQTQPDDDIEKLIESCRRTRAAGWRFVRWGLPLTGPGQLEPARSVRLGVRQVEAVRAALGDEIEICIDVHTRLDPPHAIQFCRAVEPARPFFVEDALRSEHPEAYRLLQSKVGVPLAAGEQWTSRWGFRVAIEEELIQYARIDLCLAGGLSEALKIAHWAESHYIQIAPHNPLGPVSSAAATQLCLAVANVGVLEMAREPGTVMSDLFPVQTPFRDGHALPADRPGLGIEFDEHAAASYPKPEPGFAPILKRQDGGLTNW